MLHNEVERTVKKDVKEYLDENFDRYAEVHHTKKMMVYRENLKWGITFSSGTLGILATGGGLVLLYRKLRKKKEK